MMTTTVEARRSEGVLLPQHAALIEASGISPEVAQARGYWSAQRKSELRRLGFSDSQCLSPALVVPVWNVLGELATYQIRPDQPRINSDGKAVKYETPGGSRMALDVPPLIRAKLADPSVPLWITEGVRKGDSGASAGLCCIALLGVWNWRGTNELGGNAALADWEYIPPNGRLVCICFDSDVMTKPEVHLALERLAAFLKLRGATVHFIYPPSGPARAKQGLDDYLAAGHTVEELLACSSPELRGLPSPDDEPGAGPYRETEDGIVWLRQTRDGEIPTPLTNFTARVTGQIVRDDGAETQRLFEIEANLHGRRSRFAIPSTSFNGMSWHLEHLGSEAVVYPGMYPRDHARAAIQLLSGPTPYRRLYAHTSWRKIDGRWLYLHGGGAIGADGAVGDVEVDLPRELNGYQLPTPPAGEELRAAVRASLRLLDGLAPDRVIVPLFCMTWRAPLGDSDVSGYLVGRTGLYKTSVSALAQSHFGAGMDLANLPADWKSTANYLEALAFAAKDALLIVDDDVPRRAGAAADRQQRDADRLLRGQANRSGRGRLGADSTPRPPKPPRGLIVATGEDLPRGESLGARVFVIEFRKGDVDVTALTACQADAAEGLYTAAMAGYVRWLAPRYAEISARLPGEVRELRAALTRLGMHPRTPEIAANQALGLRYFIAFAQDAGALAEKEAKGLWERGWTALTEVAAHQAAHIGTTEPTGLFIRLLSAAITSGRAHIAATNGSEPDNPEAWGWRDEPGTWQPHGDRIGWLDGEDLYLQPDASFAVAQAMGRATGEEITVSPYTLRKRLHERGLLASVDAVRKKLTLRRTLGGTRHDVLHLRADSLSAGDAADDVGLPPLRGHRHGHRL